MNENHLNDQIKNFYKNQNLSTDKLERLLSKAEGNRIDARTTRILAIFFEPKVFAIAASIMLVIVFSLMLFPSGIFEKKDLSMLVSREIVLNHNKQLAVEYNAESYVELRKLMRKLDFTPAKSSRIEIEGLTFLGARYCSIQGQLAAQIKLQDKNGRIQTLYQTQLNDSLKTLSEKTFFVDGVKIIQWQEKGIFFGLASSAND